METAIWSVAAGVALAVVLRVLPWMVRRAVQDVVAATIDPLAADLREHMAAEEHERQLIHNALRDLRDEFMRNEIEHSQLDQRLRRLET